MERTILRGQMMSEADARRVFFDGKVFYVFDEVYEPAEDTFLLAENLKVEADETVLDIGTGCGILAVLSSFKAGRVVAIDINPYAVKCARLNAEINGVSKKTDIIRGDLFGPLREDARFNLVLFNAPYLPTEEGDFEGWLDYAWSSGTTGRTLIDRFITHASRHLKLGGRILLIQSTLSDAKRTLAELKKRRFRTRIIGEHKVTFETIILIEARMPQR